MGGITSALSNAGAALDAYGKVFNTIQNNISNVNTPGWAEQDQALIPNAGANGGVIVGALISSRSQYLEQAVRTQQQQLGAASQQASDLSQIQSQFDLSGKAGVPGALNEFFNSFSQLSVHPNDATSRQNVLAAAGTAAEAFQRNARGITQLSTNIDSQTSTAVTGLNQIAAQLAAINKSYQGETGAAQNPALDAQANAALESLSQIANFSLVKTPEGTLNVYLGGQTPLVIGDNAYPVHASQVSGQAVILDSQNADITAHLQNQGGSLGAMLQEKNATLPAYLAQLNAVAKSFADSVNTALSQGLDQSGNPPATDLFTYNAALGAAATLTTNNLTTAQLAAASVGAPGGNGNALNLAGLGNQPVAGGLTLTQAYSNLAAQAGRDIANSQQDQTAGQSLLAQAQKQREQVSGVSLNAEAAKLLQFQQSYQAIGKFVSVMQTLTNTVLSMTSGG